METFLDIKNFNKSLLINHINALAFDRTASTSGEIHARDYIENQLSSNNIDTITQHFYWFGLSTKLFQILSLLFLSFLIISKLVIIAFFYIIIRIYLKKTEEKSFLISESSSNLFTIIPARNKQLKNPVIIYSAHFDSIIARYPYRFYIILNLILKVILFPLFSLILFLSCLLLVFNYLNISIDILPFYIYTILVSSVLGIIFTPLYMFMFKKETKLSKGSIDNASGVSILIELAKYYKKNPLKNYDVLFLWCGAEEWGLKGSESFYKKYIKYLNDVYDLTNSVNINIDMVGSHIGLYNKNFPYRNNSKKINNQINFSAHLLNIHIDKYTKIFNPKSDHKTFKKYCRKIGVKDFQVTCFHSISDRKFIHTIHDTPDKCSTKNLYNCFKICLHTSIQLDSDKDE